MIKFAFFGTDEFAVAILENLKSRKLPPSVIVTMPDKPRGRKLFLTPTPVKTWAEKNKIPFTTDNPQGNFDLFVVASYGKIIKKEVLGLPRFGALNIHPSLLPKYRGPSPIQTAILNDDEETGVSIMLLDEEMDHGPILSQKMITAKGKSYTELRGELATLGAEMLAEVMPRWIAGEIKTEPQIHSEATFTKKIEKSDGEINLNDDPESNFQKFRAYSPWPSIYFFDSKNRRIKITDATLENGIFIIRKVVPEGKAEMLWDDWKRGLGN
ncbi:methionyl-tRNA formyltransferase [Candidatus Nomurabacteria bacterium]|nr:methionyl-tRNA formyltransferase [Candidatus Nomurabacteria bacterium]